MNTSAVMICFVVSIMAATIYAKNLPTENNQLDKSTSSSEEISDFKEALTQIQTMCYERTNSTDAFESLLISTYGVPICIQATVDMPSLMADISNLDASTRNEFFPKYCSQMRSALVCLDPPKDEFRKCLDANDAVILDSVVNALPDAIDLLCKNDGEILFKDNANYNVCMEKYSNYATECAALVSNETDLMEVSKFGRPQCGELFNVRTCMEGKFNECNGPQVMEVFDVFWRAFIRNTPCQNFVTSANPEGN